MVNQGYTNINSGYGIRILKNGIISFISVPSLTNASPEIDRSIRSINNLSTFKLGNVELAQTPIVQTSVSEKAKISWENLEHSEIDKDIKNLSEYVKDFLTVDAKLEFDLHFINWSELIRNTEGTRIYQEFPYSILTVTGRTLNNSQQVKYYVNFGGLGGYETLPFNDFNALDSFIDIVNHLPTAKRISPGEYPTVCSEDMAWTLAHEVLGHSLEGDNVLSGKSFTAGLLGLKVAPSFVSLIDDPYIKTVGFFEFDSEGTKGRGTLLIDEGILSDFLHSRETAAAIDAESSSNYRAYDFDSLPQVRMSNIFFEPKDFSFSELLETTKNGLYIGDGWGGSSEPQTGEYTLDAQYGREIVNGELGEYYLNFQLSGRMMDTLANITGIGDRLLTQPSSCVKNNHRIYVGSVCPKIAIKSMRVR